MCGGVEYSKSGENLKIYFPNPKAALPLLTDTGNVSWVTWGNREETSHMPNGGWARLDSIYAHKWKKYHPRPVIIPVSGYMEKDHDKKSHWFELGEGMALQGLLAEYKDEQRVYVVTVDTPPEFAWVHDRWPRLVKVDKPLTFHHSELP
jgi:putative SOS response-associated peptidase YedK